MANIVISCTNKTFESFAVPMFTSFIKFNPNVVMYCIVTADVSPVVVARLKHLGVRVYKEYIGVTSHIKHTSLIIPSYVTKFDKMMWLDIDQLILNRIVEIFDYSEKIVGVPGFDRDNWLKKTADFDPYLTTGILAMDYTTACQIAAIYREHGADTTSDGLFLRKYMNDFTLRQLDAGAYGFCNILVEDAEYAKGKITYVHHGVRYIPKIAHFSKCRGGRGKSIALDKWCLDNGIQLRHD